MRKSKRRAHDERLILYVQVQGEQVVIKLGWKSRFIITNYDCRDLLSLGVTVLVTVTLVLVTVTITITITTELRSRNVQM